MKTETHLSAGSGRGLARLFLVLALAWTPTNLLAHGDGASPLYDKMEEMQGHYRTVGRAMRRPNSDDIPQLLEAVHQMQLLTVQTKVMKPSMTESLPEGEREAFVLAYRQKQIATMVSLLELEAAMLEGDMEKAAEAFTAVRTHRSEGHEAFIED